MQWCVYVHEGGAAANLLSSSTFTLLWWLRRRCWTSGVPVVKRWERVSQFKTRASAYRLHPQTPIPSAASNKRHASSVSLVRAS